VSAFFAGNSKHRKPLRAIFAEPTSPSIVFSDIELLIVALGGEVTEREGSRVKMTLRGEQWRCHRPHPGKEAKRYQVEEVRELLERVGELP
jgi:HicA toxin of bacterial toxin-antitoxin,